MNSPLLRVLDCTLRDGGYYTRWDFPRSLVNRYLAAMGASGVDTVELGLRSFPKGEFLGPYAFTSDEHVATLDVPRRLQIAVMVDAKTILRRTPAIEAAMRALFAPAPTSRIEFVRVAAHLSEVESCRALVDGLKGLGYQVGLNLMQSGGRSSDALAEKADLIARWGSVDVLYFADSLGNMGAPEVARIAEALGTAWKGPLGIHAHNNKGLALQNTLAASQHGVTWLDATVMGMGRGAGNAPTELLALELARQGYDYRSDELWELVLEEFTPLQRQHGWGASLLYHFAADHGIHPTYVQNLLGDPRYSSAQVRRAMEALAKVPSSSYNPEMVERALEAETASGRAEGTWNATAWCRDKEVVILGAGRSLQAHRQAVEHFVARRGASVLSLNLNREFEPSLVSYYVAVDSMRMSLESVDYARLKRPFILPANRASPAVRGNLESIEFFDYGCVVTSGEFKAAESGCVIPAPLSVAYALALCIVGAASRVWLAGFDGYAAGDARQEEMVDVLKRVRAHHTRPEMIAITPTTYPIDQGSVYAPYELC